MIRLIHDMKNARMILATILLVIQNLYQKIPSRKNPGWKEKRATILRMAFSIRLSEEK